MTKRVPINVIPAKKILSSRDQVIENSPKTVNPDFKYSGVKKLKFCVPTVTLTRLIKSRLTAQVANNVSSGRLYRWRTILHSMNAPTRAGTKKANGIAINK